MKANTTPSQRATARLVQMKDKLRQAGVALCDATAEEFPVGTVVEVTLNRSRLQGRVVSHSSGKFSNSYAGAMDIQNLKTGKIRRISPCYDRYDLKIVSKPKA